MEEVGTTLPQNFTQTKLELIQQIEEELVHQTKRVAIEKQAEIHLLQLKMSQLQTANNRIQAEIRAHINGFQATIDEKQEQVRGLKELTILQQNQLEVQRKEINCLSSSVRTQPREDQPQVSEERESTAVSTINLAQIDEFQPHTCMDVYLFATRYQWRI